MSDTTGEMLDRLASIGRPRLSRMDDGGWHAALDFPAPEGVTAKVASDFNHPTYNAALACLLERVAGMRNMLALEARP